MTATPSPDQPLPPSWSRENAQAGRLPARYGISMRVRFDDLVAPSLTPGVRILDVGSGRDPSFNRLELPSRVRYVGLDLSGPELQRAPPGAYDDIVVSDITRPVAALRDAFDLVVSWQVLEHVKPLAAALDNMYSYLRPGGRMVAVLSGGFSAFGLINRVLPDALGGRVAANTLRISQEDVFPAHYDRCHERALRRLMSVWSATEIHAVFQGAIYFRSYPILLRTYLAYENWAARRSHSNFATHYVLAAER